MTLEESIRLCIEDYKRKADIKELLRLANKLGVRLKENL